MLHLKSRFIWANQEKTEVKLVSEKEYQIYYERLNSFTNHGHSNLSISVLIFGPACLVII